MPKSEAKPDLKAVAARCRELADHCDDCCDDTHADPAKGFDWSKLGAILQLIQQLIPILLPLLQQKQAAEAAKQ